MIKGSFQNAYLLTYTNSVLHKSRDSVIVALALYYQAKYHLQAGNPKNSEKLVLKIITEYADHLIIEKACELDGGGKTYPYVYVMNLAMALYILEPPNRSAEPPHQTGFLDQLDSICKIKSPDNAMDMDTCCNSQCSRTTKVLLDDLKKNLGPLRGDMGIWDYNKYYEARLQKENATEKEH